MVSIKHHRLSTYNRVEIQICSSFSNREAADRSLNATYCGVKRRRASYSESNKINASYLRDSNEATGAQCIQMHE
eukprot:scaffold405918_cov15-Prasinocladus_malaysianus.AAC.1